jgi:hypothetical protein
VTKVRSKKVDRFGYRKLNEELDLSPIVMVAAGHYGYDELRCELNETDFIPSAPYHRPGDRRESGMGQESPEEYRERANFCLRAAGGSADKETWLKVAAGWLLLAQAAEDG